MELEAAKMVGAGIASIALVGAGIGIGNVFGSYLAGVLGQRYRQKHILAALYALRGVVIAAFLLLPLTPATAIGFGAAIGFLWLGTLPLTSGAAMTETLIAM